MNFSDASTKKWFVGIRVAPRIGTQDRQYLQYVLSILNHFPLSKDRINWQIVQTASSAVDRVIYYGSIPTNFSKNDFYIPSENDLFIHYSSLVCNVYHHLKKSIYSVEKVRKPAANLLTERHFGFDIFKTIFYHLSRYEEYYADPKDWDQYDMLREEKHLLVREQLEQTPVVDQLIIAFIQALNLPLDVPPTTYQLSHDIDAIRQFPSFYKYLRASARTLLDTFSMQKWWQLTRTYAQVLSKKRKDPYDTFDWLLVDKGLINSCLSCDKSFFEIKNITQKKYFFTPLKISFKIIYLLAGGNTQYEGFYNIESKYPRKVIQLAKERGYQIGLHPSYLTWRNGNMLQQEKQRLEAIVGEEVTHSRQHFLHIDFQQTPELLVAAGITEDSTLGYQNRIGFRAGTGFRYQMYDFKQKKAFPLWATPMVVMDVALLTQVDYDVVEWGVVLQRFLVRNRVGTQVVFNFHNSSFGEGDFDGNPLKFEYLHQFKSI